MADNLVQGTIEGNGELRLLIIEQRLIEVRCCDSFVQRLCSIYRVRLCVRKTSRRLAIVSSTNATVYLVRARLMVV